MACITNGGIASAVGLKTWCWADVTIPLSGNVDDPNLYIDSEGGATRQLFNDGDQIRFDLQTTNKRAELRTAPFPNNQPDGGNTPLTEEWYGWKYTFGDDYIIDNNSEWLFFQVHHGKEGDAPQIELLIGREDMYDGSTAGELLIVNNTVNVHERMGITPLAGDSLDIVIHMIWADAANGLFQVWINDVLIYNEQEKTIYNDREPEWEIGGTAKWGIYKWPWGNPDRVQDSLDQGITHVETFMGALRVITRRPGDDGYGDNDYDAVRPILIPQQLGRKHSRRGLMNH